MKILAVLDYLPNVIGGAEVSAFLVLKGLVKKDNQVYILSEQTSFQENYGRSIKEANGFSEVFRSRVVCRKTKPLWVVNDVVSLLFSFISTLHYVKTVKPDAIFTHKYAGLGAVYAAKLLNIPSIYVVRGYQHDCFGGEKVLSSDHGMKSCNLSKCNSINTFNCVKIFNTRNKFLSLLQFPFSIYGCFVMQVRRRAISKATVLVSISGAVERSLKTVYPNNIVVKIYNPIEMTGLPTVNLSHDPFGRYFVYVGRLAPVKGVSVLLRAFKQIHDIFPKCKLAIIGVGPEEDNLKKLTSTLELDSAVTFFGHLPSEEVFTFLKTRGFATIVPSLWEEAFGRVIIESMVMGVPVVATKMGGMIELISDKETGLLVNPGDERALTLSMAQLINEKALYAQIAAAASDFVKSFSIGEISSQYSKVIKNIVSDYNVHSK